LIATTALLAAVLPAVANPPSVTTQIPYLVGTTSATVRGAVNPVNKATGAWIEWGTTTNYSSMTGITNLPAAFASYTVWGPLSNLAAATTYADVTAGRRHLAEMGNAQPAGRCAPQV